MSQMQVPTTVTSDAIVLRYRASVNCYSHTFAKRLSWLATQPKVSLINRAKSIQRDYF